MKEFYIVKLSIFFFSSYEKIKFFELLLISDVDYKLEAGQTVLCKVTLYNNIPKNPGDSIARIRRHRSSFSKFY